jgi:hypothetical protein
MTLKTINSNEMREYIGSEDKLIVALVSFGISQAMVDPSPAITTFQNCTDMRILCVPTK